jgi:hypothetical protein
MGKNPSRLRTLSGLALIALVLSLGLQGCEFTSSVGTFKGSSSLNNDVNTNGQDGETDVTPSPLPSSSANRNVMPVSVNGALCSANSYINKPCVSVTICNPGTSICQTVTDILLDTGSFGLRIFKSAISGLNLRPVTNGAGKSIAECVQFGDGSSDWGQVEIASLTLAGEPSVQVPIQVIDSSFSNSSAYCSGADTDPAMAGFNGILGVGLFAQDCGSACSASASNGLYFACSGSSCSGSTVSLANQVTNPVALLPEDNNGVILELPSVAVGGAASVSGSLLLGIGTLANNTPGSVTVYPADPSFAEFTTVFNGTNLIDSFIDSGSNGLYFPESNTSELPDCGSIQPDFAGWFCPGSTTSLTATLRGYQGSPSMLTNFKIGNTISLFSGPNFVFSELGAKSDGTSFDWGLPFFLGRNIYVGFEGKSSSLGSGTYWAY